MIQCIQKFYFINIPFAISIRSDGRNKSKPLITGFGGKIEITKITLENKKSLELSEYRPVTSTFQFIFAVKPGVYTLRAEGYNFLPYTEEIVVRKEYPLVEIKKNIKVKSSK